MPQNLAVGLHQRTKVLTKAVIRSADLLGIQEHDLALILKLPEQCIHQMANNQYWLEEGSKPFKNAVKLVRLFRSLDSITGGDSEIAKNWLLCHNIVLGGRPIDKIKTDSGLVNGITYLDSRRAPL